MPKLKLVIIGGKNNLTLKNSNNVYFFENIPDQDLNFFYNSCEILIDPSIYEGFNLPIIEGLETGAIVMAADIMVNRELYDKAVVYFDPHNEMRIEKIVKDILNKPEIIRKRLIDQYTKIFDRFNWKKNTQKLLKIYKKINQK